jgi:hypothetical protein
MPSMANAALKPRNSLSCVCRQNFKKNALAASDAVTITPSRNPSNMRQSLSKISP